MGSRSPHTLGSDTSDVQNSLFEPIQQPETQAAGHSINFRSQFPEIIGQSEALLKTLSTVSKIASSESAVLILGESGTGKELISAALHRLSPRSHKNFVAINCSAIPEDLLEAHLFGHAKGAFTGADSKKVGKFEHADGGTIFLDEIGDMSPRLQAKLLRVLQEMKFSPVGSNEVKTVNVRVIAATNVDLLEAIKNKTFRLDLYYRLNVLPIHLPKLQERTGDVPILIEHFTDIVNRKNPHAEPSWMSPEAAKMLSKYTWPGNIRQLQNTVERMIIIKGGGQIGITDIPKDIMDSIASQNPDTKSSFTAVESDFTANRNTTEILSTRSEVISPKNFSVLPEDGINLSQHIEELENSFILQALERTRNNKQQAAKLLGLNRTTLVERIKKRKISSINAPSKAL